MTCAGPSELDGVVELTVVSEEPGVGLGARCAGAARTDPGAEIGEGPPHAKVRIDGHPISLWSVLDQRQRRRPSTARCSPGRRTAGGCGWCCGRRRPRCCSRTSGSCTNVADLGPELIDLPFGGSPPAW